MSRTQAIVAAFALLFLHGTETTYASETVGINLVLSLETTSYSEAAAEPRLLAPETVSLPALMAVVDSKAGVKSADLGSSSAQSVVLMAIVILLTVVQFRFIERKVNY